MMIVMRPAATDQEVQAVDKARMAAAVAGKALWEEPAATRSAVAR
jgi:hypothetical protein